MYEWKSKLFHYESLKWMKVGPRRLSHAETFCIQIPTGTIQWLDKNICMVDLNPDIVNVTFLLSIELLLQLQTIVTNVLRLSYFDNYLNLNLLLVLSFLYIAKWYNKNETSIWTYEAAIAAKNESRTSKKIAVIAI